MMDNQPDPNVINPESLLRTLLLVWCGIFFSQLLYLGLSWFLYHPTEFAGSQLMPNFPILFLIGLSSLIASFVGKKIIFRQAIESQNPRGIQRAYILAWALCEATCIFGFLGIVLDHYLIYYILFALAALGMLAHFPRRDDLHAAMFKKL